MSEKRKQVYRNEKITVRFDPNICEHAAECVNGHPGVFDVKSKPWVNVAAASPEEIIATIKKCPSGALSFELPGEGGESVETSGVVEVTVIPNGPLRLTGNVIVKDMEGNVLREMDKCSLCRCGASQKKPYCDGSHKSIDFKA